MQWLGAAVVTLALATAAGAQPPMPPQGKPPTTPATPASSERGPPVPEYAVAILCTLIILTVVCMPSRKR